MHTLNNCIKLKKIYAKQSLFSAAKKINIYIYIDRERESELDPCKLPIMAHTQMDKTLEQNALPLMVSVLQANSGVPDPTLA